MGGSHAHSHEMKSGLLRQMGLEVISHDPGSEASLVAAGWRKDVDLFRNIQAPSGSSDRRGQNFNDTAIIMGLAKPAVIFLNMPAAIRWQLANSRG